MSRKSGRKSQTTERYGIVVDDNTAAAGTTSTAVVDDGTNTTTSKAGKQGKHIVTPDKKRSKS